MQITESPDRLSWDFLRPSNAYPGGNYPNSLITPPAHTTAALVIAVGCVGLGKRGVSGVNKSSLGIVAIPSGGTVFHCPHSLKVVDVF